MLLSSSTLRKCGVKHALMQEVARLERGNFCGVCPILNRAKELRKHEKKLASLTYNGEAIRRPELTATPASTGFIMYRNEKRGTL